MSSTDDRIVRMQFDNKAFMKAAADTQKSLDDVNKAVDASGNTKGLLSLEQQMGAVSVTASKMAVVTTTALATIANKATNVALGLAKSLTFDPIRQGFQEYEALLTKQNTIMNATGLSAREVKSYLIELNEYSDQTIYSFGNMTESITKFVNAGISLPQSVKSIKGIANAAAFAGASTQDANRAMFAFSQSMSTGFLMLNDWMQIENANMATIQFKETLIDAAVEAGTLTKRGNEYLTATGKVVTATTGFRDNLKEQWATTEVLNKALSTYSDTSTKVGRQAAESATEVRTFTAFMDTLKESLGSGWSNIFTALIGNLNQATNFWTGFSQAIGGSVEKFFHFAATALKTWRQMGGFEKTLQGFKNLLAPIGALLDTIGAAWDAAFPSSDKGAGKALYGLSAGFELITRPLTWLARGIPLLTPMFTLLFKAIGGGVNIIKNIVGFLQDLVTEADALSKIDAPDASGFMGFIQDIGAFAKVAVDQIDRLIDKAGSLKDVFGNIDIDMPGLPDFGGASESASSGAASAGAAAEGASSRMGAALATLQGIAVKIGDVFSHMWDSATDFLSKITVQDVVKAFNQAIFATMAINILRLMNAFSKGLSAVADFGPTFINMMDSIGSSLEGFAQAAKREAMAKQIIAVGIALGVMAVSIWLLSKVPIDKLATALGAMGALVFLLNRAMKSFGEMVEKMDQKGTIGKTLALSVAMVALAFSMNLMATALLLMNKVEWGSLIKGLGTMAVMMKVLETLGASAKMSAGNLLAAGAALILTATAMNIMAGALMLFQLVKWESIGKAGAVLGGLAVSVGLLALIPYQGIAKVGGALLLASVGMLAMANALVVFALVKWESIGKAAVMLALLTVSLAVLMAVGGPASVAAMLGLAGAMVLLALSCIMFNHVDWESIGKATVVLTVLLAALAVGAVIMTAFLYAIAPVSPVLLILAAGFALLGVGLLAFAAAMTIAMGLAAAGTAAFAALATGAAVAVGVFFQTLALQAPIMRESILDILQEMINTVVEAVPMIIRGFKDLWKAIMKELQSGDKKRSFGEIAHEWIGKLIEFARREIPRLNKLAVDLALSMLQALARRAEAFANAGTDFVVALIRGVQERQQRIVDAAIDLVIAMAEGFRKNTKKLTDAGIDLVAGFLHDLADSIRNGSSKIGAGISDLVDAFRDVGVDMIEGLINGASSVDIQGFIEGLASQLPGWAKKVLGIKSPSRVFMEIGKFLVQGLTKGIQDNAASSIVAVSSMLTGAIALADEYVSKYIQKLDQQAMASRARAQGLAAAALKATKSAKKTKDEGDNRAARELRQDARKANREAAKDAADAKKAREAARRKERWENADAAQRAEIRAAEVRSQIDRAKQAERDAASARIQANALERQAREAGTAKERQELLEQVEKLRKQAREDAKRANKLLKGAETDAADALKWQKIAGEQAAEAFQEQFDAEAQADADAEAFEKLTDAEKAAKRREQAAALQASAQKNLEKAKELAYTDLEAANRLAEKALEEAEQAREFLKEAEGYSGGSTNEVINLRQSDAAALAFNDYKDLYDAAYAAAAGGTTVEFNQYNNSPESLSPAEIYRQTNNQLTFASEKLAGAAA